MGTTMCCGGGRLTPAENYKDMEKKIKATGDIPHANAQAWAKFFADSAAVSDFAIDHTDLRAAQRADGTGDAKMREALRPMIAKYKANVESIFAEVFARHDKAHSGFLDKQQFKAVLQEWAAAQNACLTNCIDAIGNAYVDKTMELVREQGIANSSALLQAGGAESLVRLKINEHLNAMEKKQRARLQDIMTHADTYADQLFRRLDPDATGKISAAVFVENNRKPFAELLKGQDFGRVDLVGEAFNPQRFDVDNLHAL